MISQLLFSILILFISFEVYPEIPDKKVEIIKVHNGDRLAKGEPPFYYGAATFENKRGKGGNSFYKNQDRVFLCSLLGRVACVLCDGHGQDGGLVAEKISSQLPIIVCNYYDVVQGFESAIAKLQKNLTNQKYAQESGTTCVAAVIADDVLTVANVGDSRLIVFNLGNKDNPIRFSTIDHKPTTAQEEARILAAGGRVVKGYAYGPNSNVGFALSRSLGDVCAHDKDVITAQPDISKLKLEIGDFIIIGSDGLWDVIKNEDLYEAIACAVQDWNFNYLQVTKKPTNDDLCTQIADILMTKARQYGSKDDITCAVLLYDHA